MADDSKVKEAVEWYSKRRFLYDTLAKKVETTVREILKSKDVNYHSVTSRPKSISRYKEKASEEKYKEPLSEIFDMAGIRVITYTDSDAKRVHEIIKKSFKLRSEHSVDKTEELGVDRVGYRSIHCVGTLGKDRLKLPENQLFKDMVFEIQIRTILQHAWAEFEHDRNYKFSGVLPKDVRRRLAIVAGNLELLDKEFDDISKEIDSYTVNIEKSMESGDLREPINSASLKAYMNKKLEPLIKEGVVRPHLRTDNVIIEELSIMGIDTLEKLDDVIPKDFVEKVRLVYLKDTRMHKNNFNGILRQVMIIHDVNTYFRKAWRRRWSIISPSTISIVAQWEVEIDKFIKKYKLSIARPRLAT